MTLTRTRTLPVAATALTLASLLSACGGDAGTNNARKNSASDPSGSATANAASSTGATADISKLDAEIARLEKQAEKNPADEETRQLLAQTHVLRANAHRAASRMREALDDYRRAQRLDPDNEEALKNISELSPLVEGTPQEGEYGEPPPLPVNPSDSDDEKPTPTPKKQ